MRRYLILQLGILTLIAGLNSAIDIIQPPTDVQVKQGATGILSCVFSEAVVGCLWTMNGGIVRPGDRYTYTHTNDGDCSITISESDVQYDDGIWQCQLPKGSGFDGIVSVEAKYTVLVTPDMPIMLRDGWEKIENKSYIVITDFEDQPNISCQSTNGNPAASLKFILGYSKKVLEANYSIVEGSLAKTQTAVLDLLTPLDPSWGGEVLVCVANHSSYDSGVRFTAAFIGHPSPPTEVKAYSSNNNQGDHIQVGTSDTIHLVCEAKGRPPLVYEWMIRPDQNAKWTDYQSGQNTSFIAFTTQIKCVVWSVDINNTAESNYITIEAVKTETGAIIAIVVVCVVVVILMAAGVYGLYRKKMWCFKTPHKQNSAGDGNKNLEGVRVYDAKAKEGDEAIHKEQTDSLLKDASVHRKSDDSSHEDAKPIIYADLQFQPAKNAEPPVKISTEYASVKRPYGIQ